MKCSLLLATLICLLVPLPRAVTQSATPADVWRELQAAKHQVQMLMALRSRKTDWPKMRVTGRRYPRHNLQKSFEILEKISRLRVNRGLGAITIPVFPARQITPNEVLRAVRRIHGELYLLTEEKRNHQMPPVKMQEDGGGDSITKAEVYGMLWSISLAMDHVLGVRGFTPADVYAQSVRVLENSRFLRQSQNLRPVTVRLKRTEGRQPNHTMQSALRLLATIATAERRLWMVPCVVPKQARKRIEPFEVYDILQMVLAEQQRLKHRLGIEKHFTPPLPDPRKTPDDVILNLEKARLLLPMFQEQTALVQYDAASLVKRPEDVYEVGVRISSSIQRLRTHRGIRQLPRTELPTGPKTNKHIYQKTVQCIEKVNRLRSQFHLGKFAVLSVPLREITSTEVYDLAIRLDAELQLIEKSIGVQERARVDSVVPHQQNRSAESIHALMTRNLHALDTLLGGLGYTPNDVHQQVLQIIAEIDLLRRYRGSAERVIAPKLIGGKQPRDVFKETEILMSLLYRLQRRAGMIAPSLELWADYSTVTPNEVYNGVGKILMELSSLKTHLGIKKHVEIPATPTSKTPSDVFRQVRYARLLIECLLQDSTARYSGDGRVVPGK